MNIDQIAVLYGKKSSIHVLDVIKLVEQLIYSDIDGCCAIGSNLLHTVQQYQEVIYKVISHV